MSGMNRFSPTGDPASAAADSALKRNQDLRRNTVWALIAGIAATVVPIVWFLLGIVLEAISPEISHWFSWLTTVPLLILVPVAFLTACFFAVRAVLLATERTK